MPFSHLVYATSPLVAVLVVYRPFITRLDCMRYILFCTVAVIITLLLFLSSLSVISSEGLMRQHHISVNLNNNTIRTASSRAIINSSFNQWETPASTILTLYKSYHYNQSSRTTATLITLLEDVSLLALTAATSISFSGIISRWDFPILHVKPQEHIFYDFLYRHVSSVAFILMGSYR